MEYTAVLIRWCWEPTHHINAQPPLDLEIAEWCLSRWEGQTHHANPHLTIFCMKNKTSNAAAVEAMVLGKASNLWIRASGKIMRPGTFETIVSVYDDTITLENMYVTMTSSCLGSFFEYTTYISDLMRNMGWIETSNSLCGDEVTMYKLHCKHVSRVCC